MARLGRTYKPELFDLMQIPVHEWDERQKKADKELEQIADRTVSFPIADGQAIYYVESLEPLILRHVPYGDAWQIPAAHMRGLRRQDIEKQLKRKLSWGAPGLGKSAPERTT